MAGSQDPDENPVAINVVPMVDVIFCLCVFFMCSFKFKEVEGRFDAWLPKDRGHGTVAESVPESLIAELRVAVRWDDRANAVTRQVGSRRVETDAELQELLRGAHADEVAIGVKPRPVTIDAEAAVPWRDVVTIINLCKRENIDRIEFAYGTGK